MALIPCTKQSLSARGGQRRATKGPGRYARAGRMSLAGASIGVAALFVLGVSPQAVAGPKAPHLQSDTAAPANLRAHLGGGTLCSNPATITSCVMGVLAPGGGQSGVYLKQVGGSVLASSNATVPYEPASSIKPVIALYAMKQVQSGALQLTTKIPEVNPFGGADDCPTGSIIGTETLATAVQKMLQVSDNNRTEELMEYFGVANLNSFAASLGLSSTMFQTSGSAPGFNVIGCLSYPIPPLPSTLDGNTMSLADVTTLWNDIASLPAPYADTLYQLAAGRDMFNSTGSDFTGTWPIMQTIVQELNPPGLSVAQTNSFIDHMSVSVKGGSYDAFDCTSGTPCEATWWVFAGVAQIPGCVGHTVVEKSYDWGYFVADSTGPFASNPDDTPGGVAFFNGEGQVLAAPIAQGLATWSTCAPVAKVKLHVAKGNISTGMAVPVSKTVTTVTDSDTSDIATDMTAKISWGDRSFAVPAVLTGGHGTFTVHGWHAYTAPGLYKATIMVTNLQSHRTSKGKVKITVS